MRALRAFAVRIAHRISRRQLERDLADEIASHVEMHAADNRRAGMSPAEARRAAIVKLGGIEATREAMRDAATLAWLDTLLQDVRHAVRALWRAPIFTSAALGSLTLGLGAGLAVFTVADNVLLRPLPYRDPTQLMVVREVKRQGATAAETGDVSPGNYLDWKAQTDVFESIAGFRVSRSVFAAGARVEELAKLRVTADLLPMLGVRPILGRLFTPDEDRPGVDVPLIISHRVWQEWFAGDPAIIGRAVQVNATPRTIVGVMPSGFYFRERSIDLWEPLGLNPARDYRATEGRWLSCLARLKAGGTMAEAQMRMAAVAARLETDHPAFNRTWTVEVEPLKHAMVGDIRRALLMLLGAVGLLLAVSCTNVAGLLLARFTARRRELAVRASLGAGRWRVVRLLLTEGLVLGLTAGIAALVLARWIVSALLALSPTSLVHGAEVRVDWRIVLSGIFLSLFTAVIFGLAPALMATGTRLVNSMRDDERTATTRRVGVRGWLVSAEVAVTVVLLIGAVLLFRSLVGLQALPTGFDTSNLLTLRVSLPAVRYRELSRRTQFFARAIETIEHLPGVLGASATSMLPFGGTDAVTPVIVEGQPTAQRSEERLALVKSVMPGYFRAMGIPLRGRDFSPADHASGAPMRFVVSETLVRSFLPGDQPLGRRLRVGTNPGNPAGEIIGVVGDVRELAPGKPSVPTVYYVYERLSYASMSLVVRTARDPASLVDDVRHIITTLDPAQPISDVRLMEDTVGDMTARERFSTVLLSTFSGLSLLLACVGIYGVVAYTATQRTREIGVRIALGARPARIVWLVVGAGARMIVTGVLVGIASALTLSSLIETLLFRISPRDVTTFVVAPVALATLGLAAAALPALGASRIDPMRALRGD